jgi:hypothetical protein
MYLQVSHDPQINQQLLPKQHWTLGRCTEYTDYDDSLLSLLYRKIEFIMK